MIVTAAPRRSPPEVVQTSAMDCGPASLKSLLGGHGVEVSYSWLREVCQTDVDGTSIDELEEVAASLGLPAEQIMTPRDHLLLPEACALPAIVVVTLPSGATHFVVVWRRIGPYVLVMDPAEGRRWVRTSALLETVYVHHQPVPAEAWREWAGDVEFGGAIGRRLAALGASRSLAASLIARAREDASWVTLSRLDAAVRMAQELVDARAVRKGAQALGVVSRALDDPSVDIPGLFFSVAPCPPEMLEEDDEPHVILSGAVVVRVDPEGGEVPQEYGGDPDEVAAEPPPEAIERSVPSAWRTMLGLVVAEHPAVVLTLGAIAVVLAGALTLEAVLLRGLLELPDMLRVPEQRGAALAALIAFMAAVLALSVPMEIALRRMGRSVEVTLRARVQQKIPRLRPRFMASRLRSDMAERAHALRGLRALPEALYDLVFAFAMLLGTAGALTWIAPALAPWVAASMLLVVVTPLSVQPLLGALSLRARTHEGALTRFFLDALIGAMPVRAHAAERAVRLEHESLLVSWVRASTDLLSASVLALAAQSIVSYGVAIGLCVAYVLGGGSLAGLLLMSYFALRLPSAGAQLAGVIGRYPSLRSTLLRVQEILDAEAVEIAYGHASSSESEPARIELEGAAVSAGGHTILTGVTLTIEPGEHVAIVGPSGAGKSTLVHALMGLHELADGTLLVDGLPLDPERLLALRERTAWVDPAVHLWNTSLFRNLTYGTDAVDLATILEASRVREFMGRLPDGLQTALGESGRRLSGGEGQRVRLGRAMARQDARLVLLDEPFRGLEREVRRQFLGDARAHWEGRTLLCVTHDVAATQSFDRVLVVDAGEVVEDGVPSELAAADGTRYRDLLSAQRELDEEIWSDPRWTRASMQDGSLTITEVGRAPDTEDASEDEEPTQDDAPLAEHDAAVHVRHVLELFDQLALGADMVARQDGTFRPATALSADAAASWEDALRARALELGTELVAVHAPLEDLPGFLEHGAPMLLHTPAGLLAVVGASSSGVQVLGLDGAPRWVPREEVELLCASPAREALSGLMDALFDGLDISERRQERAEAALRGQILGNRMHAHGFMLRPPPARMLGATLKRLGVPRRVAALVILELALNGLFVGSWWLLGQGALQGRLDTGWLSAWALVLTALVLAQIVHAWTSGLVTLHAATAIKARMLHGALRVDAEVLRTRGVGQLMGKVFESEVLGSAALAGAFSAFHAVVELIAAGLVLAMISTSLTIALGVWGALTVVLALGFLVRQRAWTAARVEMTHDLVERMLGHTTRVQQEPPERWHDVEDALLAAYVRASRRLDLMAVALQGIVPRGWSLLSLALLAPMFLRADGLSMVQLAGALGGILLAGQALGTLVGTLSAWTDTLIAWEQTRELFSEDQRASYPGDAGAMIASREPSGGEGVLTLQDVTFRHDGRADAVLDGCSVEVGARTRVLVQGASGSGKSTMASLMAGMREPTQGLVLLRGVDLPTWGTSRWRERVVSVPQFHENHILSASMGFNLLMGAEWPATPDELEHAQQICEELRLGELLGRMPQGMMQMVGETGWALSHGEQHRVFVARALLQNPDVILFDESFAALDPETLVAVMRCVWARAPAMVVITHDPPERRA